jgi:hypothetical protein
LLGLLLLVHLGAQFGIFGAKSMDFGLHLLQLMLHFLCLDFLSVAGVLSSFAVLHLPAIHLLLHGQVVETLSSTLRLLM